ncbi:MAG: alpha-1,2-fucosyltransferase [Psychroserpens sp.]|uniref:alpha-1,2-fucosyltransferase n=1 Tax=Psychroserpens sp. TaxID=2020870 RepID=UPI003C9AE980
MGGLGNQMYQYAAGKALAVRLNKTLIIDPRPILAEAHKRQYDLYIFNLEYANFGTSYTLWLVRWISSVRLGRLFQVLNPSAWSYRIIRDKEMGFDTSLYEVSSTNLILHGYWQSYKYFEDLRLRFLNEFTFKNEPNSKNKEVLNEIDESNSVAIHIRRGDYVNNSVANSLHGICSMEYYKNGVAFINQNVENPNFFIFTDDPIWAKQNFKLVQSPIVVEHNLGNQDFEDLRLMSHCKHFIIANSSFSWWGAWLGTDKNKIVICPKKWFNTEDIPLTDRIPNAWIKI